MIDFINTANNTSININQKIYNDQGAQRNKTQTIVILMSINTLPFLISWQQKIFALKFSAIL